MTDNYEPIDCGLHSEYELLAMHRSRIKLAYHTVSGKSLQAEGRVIDVQTRDRAEYMVLDTAGQSPLAVRLDRIHSFVELDG